MIAKGIMYHFNILNDDQHFGYFYDNKENTWKDLDRKQMKYNTTNKYTVDFPIVTVPYFDWNSFVHTWFQVLLINALLFLNVHKNLSLITLCHALQVHLELLVLIEGALLQKKRGGRIYYWWIHKMWKTCFFGWVLQVWDIASVLRHYLSRITLQLGSSGHNK